MKPIMKNYFVEYTLDGVKDSKKIEASDPGHAFQKAIKQLPVGAVIIRAHIEGRLAGNNRFERVWINYDAPKNMRLTYPEFAVDKYEQTSMNLGT